MQTFYISCEPQKTEFVVALIKEISGYQFLGQEQKTKRMVFCLESEDGIASVFSLVRGVGGSVSRDNPLEKQTQVLV